MTERGERRMINLTEEQVARLVEIAREHSRLAINFSQESAHMTPLEKAEIKARIEELRRERDALLMGSRCNYCAEDDQPIPYQVTAKGWGDGNGRPGAEQLLFVRSIIKNVLEYELARSSFRGVQGLDDDFTQFKEQLERLESQLIDHLLQD